MKTLTPAQAIVTIVVLALATTAKLTGTGVSPDALVGLYGSALGYVFGVSNGKHSAREQWTHQEREIARMKARVK